MRALERLHGEAGSMTIAEAVERGIAKIRRPEWSGAFLELQHSGEPWATLHEPTAMTFVSPSAFSIATSRKRIVVLGDVDQPGWEEWNKH